MSIKKMSVKEFRELGYLSELNRQFLHPLGLAIEVEVNEAGDEFFGEVWDSREDKEGILFSEISDDQKKKGERITEEQKNRGEERKSSLGFVIQPLDNKG